MIKKIKITNNKARMALRDTTNGCVYPVIEVPEGAQCPNGTIAVGGDLLSFKDSVGDWVNIHKDGRGYGVAEEDSSMTNNNWNTVNWDEIPDDVDAVVTFAYDEPSYYKEVEGKLQVQCYRSDSFKCSGHRDTERAIEYFGDRFHLRPTPTSQPITEPPESAQVGTLGVEATTTPEFDWSSVEDDVESVVVSPQGRLMAVFKEETNHLLIGSGSGRWYVTRRSNTIDKYPLGQLKTGNGILIRRPPATTTPEAAGFEEVKGSTDLRFKCREAILSDLPSISTILQEAQQSILKHHGVTGEVKFTVTCSQ